MGLEHLVSNSTFTENNTDKLDIYCKIVSVTPVIYTSLTTPAICVGLPATAWLLWVFAQRRHNGLAINTYMLNVTIMDFIFNISEPLITLNNYLWRDDTFTIIGMITFSITTTGRPLFAVCMCFECYMAALLPIRYMKMKNSRFRLVVSSLIWIVTCIYGGAYTNNPNLIYTPLLMIPFAVSLANNVLFDVLVLHALRKPDPSGKREVHPQKIKALQTITFNLVVTVVAYLPPVVVFGCSSLMSLKKDFLCDVGILSLILPVFCSAIMPLLYLKKLGIVKDVNGCGRPQRRNAV